MSATPGVGYYVPKPQDKYWNACVETKRVIKARSFDAHESGLYDWQKTDEYVKNHLKVIEPSNFRWSYVKKEEWTACSGPSRDLKFKEYVELYHSSDPQRPLPFGWEQFKSQR